MNQFLMQQGSSEELGLFPHIIEFGMKKVQTIQFHSLSIEESRHIRIYYILEGKFEWNIGNGKYMLYPADLALILPGQPFGGAKEFLDIGSLSWIALDLEGPGLGGERFGPWSGLSAAESRSIRKILLLNHNPVVAGEKGYHSNMQQRDGRKDERRGSADKFCEGALRHPRDTGRLGHIGDDLNDHYARLGANGFGRFVQRCLAYFWRYWFSCYLWN